MASGRVFILHKLFAVFLYLKSKESCIQKGFVGRNTFTLGLTTSVLLLGFYFWSEAWSLMIQVYVVLIFHCIHLIPGKSIAGQVTGFSLHSSKLIKHRLHKGRLMAFYTTHLINIVFFEKWSLEIDDVFQWCWKQWDKNWVSQGNWLWTWPVD